LVHLLVSHSPSVAQASPKRDLVPSKTHLPLLHVLLAQVGPDVQADPRAVSPLATQTKSTQFPELHCSDAVQLEPSIFNISPPLTATHRF
jgi:hypothetical protein